MERNSNPNHHYNSSNETRSPATTSSDFVLQWGSRKRLRCMKFQAKVRDNGNNRDSSGLQPGGLRAVVGVDRRLVRSDHNKDLSQPSDANNSNGNSNNGGNVYLNLRQRPASPSHRILRNSESSLAMRGQSNGVRGLASPDRVGAGGHDRKGGNNSLHHHSNGTKNNSNNNNDNSNNNNDNSNNINGSASSDSRKGGGTSSGSDAIPAVWPPKFVIALTNKEKEEDFMAIKGSKLPQRPKKRAKFIQRTLNLVSPGAWLCDLTLERYEVREKKVSKKRPRGLRAMGNMDSDSE
ncbi:uncharacterized protein [Coffea arabica]|uniref:Uncharacterized protein n=1 Tax=Coffea arabica TaxID=13443 RepID=A0A6P6TUC5_COFAR